MLLDSSLARSNDVEDDGKRTALSAWLVLDGSESPCSLARPVLACLLVVAVLVCLLLLSVIRPSFIFYLSWSSVSGNDSIFEAYSNVYFHLTIKTYFFWTFWFAGRHDSFSNKVLLILYCLTIDIYNDT